MEALQKWINQAPGTALILHEAMLRPRVAELSGDVQTLAFDDPSLLRQDKWPALALVMHDTASMRRQIRALPRIGRTKHLAVFITDADSPAVVMPRPEWPKLIASHARMVKGGLGALTTMKFARPVSANSVLEEVARQAVPLDAGEAGLVVAATPDVTATDRWTTVLADVADASDPRRTVPPDILVVMDLPVMADAVLAKHHVTDRSPVLTGTGVGAVGPIDEGVLNPTGFLQHVEGSVLTLEADGERLLLRGAGIELGSATGRGATTAMVKVLRAHRGVRIDGVVAPARELATVVAGLAAAGVPVEAHLSHETAASLGPLLQQALDHSVDLGDALRREEHSVLLRRAALLEHSTRAWRGRLAAQAGVAFRRFPTVSVLLATKRPDMVEHALRQVAKQRGADLDLELVLVTHGFSVEAERVRAAVPGRNVVVASMPEGAFFGDVLNDALDRSSGDLVIKMDDDDWYGPDFLVDLLLAREYTGADLLGTTGEYIYLAPLDRTVRRNDDSERAAKFVAGGSMMLGRSVLRELGGFRRVRKYVDAQLLAAVHAMGGHVYRGHGLGYVLRRNSAGHTWDPGLGYYLDEKRMGQQWEGFVPSRILEFDETERP